jgi:hypothetical protein
MSAVQDASPGSLSRGPNLPRGELGHRALPEGCDQGLQDIAILGDGCRGRIVHAIGQPLVDRALQRVVA